MKDRDTNQDLTKPTTPSKPRAARFKRWLTGHCVSCDPSQVENLMVRVDRSSKGLITKAARLRGVSASDYVRSVVVSQARREVKESQSQTLSLSPEDQLAFWRALERTCCTHASPTSPWPTHAG